MNFFGKYGWKTLTGTVILVGVDALTNLGVSHELMPWAVMLGKGLGGVGIIHKFAKAGSK